MKSILCARVFNKEKISKSYSILRFEKILFLLLIASILISSSLGFAEIKDTFIAPDELDDFSSIYIHQGMFNGEDWIELSHSEKRAYLLGYEDGFIFNTIFYVKDEMQSEHVLSTLPTSIAELSTDDLINKIDNLYKDSQNIQIPVPFALIIVRNKLLGIEQVKIDSYIEYLRSQSKKISDDKK